MLSRVIEASSNGRTADFGSAHEGSNPSASASPAPDGEERGALGRPARLLLVGLGGVTARQLADAGLALRETLRVTPLAGPPLDRPAYAHNGPRGQYHAPAIVRRLSALRAGVGGAPVIGVVDVDLFVPDAEFVLVDAERDEAAAVVSTARLRSDEPARLRRRLQAEVVHAAGRLAGLSPCPDPGCALFTSLDAADSDRKGTALCGACRAALGL